MYIELIDLLRCPNPHEDSWLVAAFHKMDARFIIDGKLGCPVCSASYPIDAGIANLRAPGPHQDNEMIDSNGSVGAEDDPMRAAAMLGLERAGSVAVLFAMSADICNAVAELANARVISLNPVVAPTEEKENVATVLCGSRLPLAPGSVDGMMIGGACGSAGIGEALRVLKPGGRLVVRAGTILSGGLRQLAQDEHYVVAESTGPLLSLSR